MRHLAGAALGAVVLVLLATGCTPDPAPTPSPTGFASNEEAFAAAEATYRAYVDAVSAAQSGVTARDPASFLTGQALEDEIRSARELKAEERTLEGPVSVLAVENIDASSSEVTIQACLDLSRSRVVSSGGEDVTPDSRPDSFSVEVDVVWTPVGPLVASSESSQIPC